MMYNLLIGDRSYSSWSLRGWLSFAAFDIPVQVKKTTMYCDQFALDREAFYPGARTVPLAQSPDGVFLTDSLAIAWHLAEAFPDKGLLPKNPEARATAMCLISEMHSGHMALRSACAMNLRTGWKDFETTDAIQADLDRIDFLFSRALDAHGGPWLCGAFSLADVFYAPVATRILTYDLPVTPRVRAYAEAMIAITPFRQWRAIGLVDGPEQSTYDMDLPRQPFPALPVLAAKAVENGTPENALCPYSGDPVTDLMELDGRIFGFCNPFCRDKTVADPEAWPKFMAIYQS